MYKVLKTMSKIALVHDQLTQYGGAEKVLDVFHKIYPTSPIFTTVYLKNRLPDYYSKYDIHCTFLNKLNLIKNKKQLRTLLFPLAINTLKLNDYDLIISDTQGISKGVKTNMSQFHISYVHTIPWAVWNLKNEKGRYLTKYFGQKWDFKTAQFPNILIANSKHTQKRIGIYYKRDSLLLYPPVDITTLENNSLDVLNKNDYGVFLGRLEGYKGEMELAQACTAAKQKLIIIGKGKNELKLKNYSKYIELKNNVDDIQKAKILKSAKFLFNGSVEDFGINMVEALSLGTPIIALGKGGACEIVNNQNGILIDTLSVSNIILALNELNRRSFNTIQLKDSVDKFRQENFVINFKNIINSF